MPKDEWGVKRACPECQERFYDLNKDPLVCPECGMSVTLESFLSDKPQIEKATPAPAASDDASDAVIDDDADVLDESADIPVDDDLLEDDDDDNVSLDELADVASDDEEN